MLISHQGRPPERFLEAADAERAALREAVASVDRFIAHLPSAHAGPDQGLSAAWAALVKCLALDAPRQLRDCPRCGEVCMRDATLCSHCWSRLAAVASSVPVNNLQVAGGVDS